MVFTMFPVCRALALLLLLFIAQSAHSQTLYGTYKIQSLATGELLGGNETRMYAANTDGTSYQVWSLQRTDMQVQGHAVYAIRNGNTGKCLEGTQSKIQLANCDGGTFQIWKVEPADVADHYWITNLVTNRVLDANESQIYPSDRNGGNYQKWRLLPIAKRVDRTDTPPASRVGTAVYTAPPARNVAPPAYPDTDPRRVHRYLRRNMTFAPGSSVESKNGRYQVYFQEDGNMVVYRLTDRPKKALWASNTVISDIGKFSFQDDGNLVIYNRNGQAVWATGTDGRGEYMLLQNDGNLVIYNQSGVAIWASNTNE